MQQRLIEIYQNIPDHVKREGRIWYPNAKRHFQRMAHKHNIPLKRLVGCVAALSPFVSWRTQLERTPEFIRTGSFLGFKSNVRTANRILSGGNPDRELRGPKTLRFFRNIMGCTQSVTIDRHAHSAAIGIKVNSSLNISQYKELEKAYQEAAKAVGEFPRDFQAMVWIWWRL